MSLDILPTRANGQFINSWWFNIWRKILSFIIVPRNTSGAPTSEAGSLGTSTYKFERMHVSSGYLYAGMIKYKYDYNGTVSIEPGWFPCDGSIINEANYNTIHGAGKWDADIVSSPLDGKYTPNLDDVYLVGSTDATDPGTSPISTVGLSSNEIDIQHSHTNTVGDNAYSTTEPIMANTLVNTFGGLPHKHAVTIPNGLTTNQDITPHTIVAKAYMRII
jgi:hypothetical protein